MNEIPKDWSASFEVDGIGFKASLVPSSWKYRGYKLQLDVEMAGGGGHEIIPSEKPFSDCTVLDAYALITTIKHRLFAGGLSPCPECGETTWNRTVFPSETRDARCERCWMREWRDQWNEEANLERVKQEIHDLDMARKGFTHSLEAWIHTGKDDRRLMQLFLREAVTDKEVAALLKKQGCKLQNDFQVRKLPAAMSFEEAKARADQLNINARAAGLKLDAFSANAAAGSKLEAAKGGEAYRQAKARFETAKHIQHAFNRWYEKVFRVSIQQESETQQGSEPGLKRSILRAIAGDKAADG